MLPGVKAIDAVRNIPKPVLALLVVVLVAAVAGPVFLGGDPSFDGLEDLERAQEKGEEAASSSDRIRKSLEEIAENLREGSGISGKGDRIEELTAEQRRSLQDLVAVLETQLGVLDRSSGLVGETTESTTSLAEISERQAQNLEEAIAVLRDIEDLAAEASASSADMSRQALYGARLAEDSEDAFRP
jgi:methyl-accepting chemotaxis protein